MSDLGDLLAQFSELPVTSPSKGRAQALSTRKPEQQAAARAQQPGSLASAPSQRQRGLSQDDRPSPSSRAPIPATSSQPTHIPSPSASFARVDRPSAGGLGQARNAANSSGGLPQSVDELLSDLDIPTETVRTAPTHSRHASSGQQALNPKCMGVYLGGAEMPRGRNGTEIGVLRCCDALRCTKCDFKVISFPQRCWRSGCDYLFFRNNYPTEAKLSPMLDSVPGSCAYACQCTWRSVTGREGLRVDSYASDVRWICGGHAG